MEYPAYPKCVECDGYDLIHRRCWFDSTPREPLDEQCDKYPHESTSPAKMQAKLRELTMLIGDLSGGKYYSFAPMCAARHGICPKGHDGICTKDAEKITQGEIDNRLYFYNDKTKGYDCSFKFKYENPNAPAF
jgi:hypothetical protein